MFKSAGLAAVLGGVGAFFGGWLAMLFLEWVFKCQ
jgi:hypothetical protein